MQLDPSPILTPAAHAMSLRDRAILSLATRKLAGGRRSFDEAVRALREAVEESIPSGRLFLLGRGRVVGSILSGVGIMEAHDGIRVVRVVGDDVEQLGRLR
jgi:hypothetical protein